MNTSRTIWTVDGKTTKIKYKQRGLWVKVRGKASQHGIFKTDNSNIDVWIRQEVFDQAHKDIHEHIKVYGHFVFEKDQCWFLAEKIA